VVRASLRKTLNPEAGFQSSYSFSVVNIHPPFEAVFQQPNTNRLLVESSKVLSTA
jgi:hypothetical protein